MLVIFVLNKYLSITTLQNDLLSILIFSNLNIQIAPEFMKMNKHGDSDISLSADDDEYQRQENKITDLIEIYKEKRKKATEKQLNFVITQYEILLEGNYASPAKWTWLAEKKAQLQALKTQKMTQNQQQNARNIVTKDHIAVIDDINKNALKYIEKDLTEAIEISTLIKEELNKQIDDLDRVYDVQKTIDYKIKRSMDGLRTMLRRIMMSKMTRFLSVLTVLAIIALIVVYALKSNGVIP